MSDSNKSRIIFETTQDLVVVGKLNYQSKKLKL